MKQTSDKLEFQDKFVFWVQLYFGVTFLVTGLLFGLLSGNFFVYLLAVGGLLLVIFLEIVTITFDKNLGHMTIKRHKPLLAKTEVVKHLIQDISGVEIQQMMTMEVFFDLIQNIPGMERKQRRTRDSSDTYRVCLVLKSCKRGVPLTSYFNGNLGHEHKKAEVIARFLDIRNYGFRGLIGQETSSAELQSKTVEEKILHWETAIKSDPSDADAHIKLALALIRQGKTKNKEPAMGYLKQAEAIFKSQGYDDGAKMVALLHDYLGMLVE